MERLFAPWRMPYIRSGGTHEPGCVFCRVLSAHGPESDEQNLVLFRDEETLIMLNRFPYNNGHLLVMPVAHGADFAGLPTSTAQALMLRLQQTVAILKKAYGCEGINVGMNLGACAGAGVVDHMHFHVLPRWGGDTNFMPVIADIRVIPESLHDTWRGLRPFFAELS